MQVAVPIAPEEEEKPMPWGFVKLQPPKQTINWHNKAEVEAAILARGREQLEIQARIQPVQVSSCLKPKEVTVEELRRQYLPKEECEEIENFGYRGHQLTVVRR